MNERFRNILLDRDGTIIEERHYLADPDRVQLIPGAGQALRALMDAGHRLFLITNQSGIGRGFFSLAQHEAVQERLAQLLRQFNVEFTDTAMCPHAPRDNCDCRKPRIGLWEHLRRIHDLNPDQCLMIGDKLADIRFAQSAGLAGSILVLTGHGQETLCEQGWAGPAQSKPDLPPSFQLGHLDQPVTIAPDLATAAEWILKHPSRLTGNVD